MLNKGLNFCITNLNGKNASSTFEKDISKFRRTLQIKYIFQDEDDIAQKFTGNPDWQPPNKKCSPELDGFTEFIETEFNKLTKNIKTKHNISKKDRNAINLLRYNEDIIIQKADKGGSIVVISKTEYLQKMQAMLDDPITYTVIPTVDLIAAKSEIDQILASLYVNEYLTKKQFKHLRKVEPKLPVLYGLPKIHKKDCPFRPIVSQINSPSYKINKYLDYLLTTAEKNIPNLLQDTTKFLQIINNLDALPNDCLLFTIDVTSLYTVLPHNLVLKYVIEMYSDTLHLFRNYTPDITPIPAHYLREIIEIVLKQTFFSFNNTTYQQNFGITMGAPSSVKLANITLHKHLDNILANYKNNKPFLQLRLIDDIFGIWVGPKNELLNYITFLNDSHDTIKFTSDISQTEIAFLDTLAYIEDNKIKTKLYKKPTDNKQYLHFNSEHPKHVKEAIPYAQALRYRRIIEDNNIFKTEIDKLKNSFLVRNYPEDVINKAIHRVEALDRSDTIAYRRKKDKTFDAIPLVLTYNNALIAHRTKNVHKILAKAWDELTTAYPELQNLPKPKIVFKRTLTINSLLVSTVYPPPRWSKKHSTKTLFPTTRFALPTAKTQHTTLHLSPRPKPTPTPNTLSNPPLSPPNPNPTLTPNPQTQHHTPPNPNPTHITNPLIQHPSSPNPNTIHPLNPNPHHGVCRPCYATNNKSKTAKCLTCTSICYSNTFHSSTHNKTFFFTDYYDCVSTNIVYLITCTKCHIQYIGETKNSLRTRLNHHRHDILHNYNTPIGIHFNSINHNFTHLQIAPIEIIHNDDISLRRKRENFWQFTIGTMFPNGLNAFPVEKRDLFENFEIIYHNDLNLYVTLKALENGEESNV